MSERPSALRPPTDRFLQLLEAHHRWADPARHPTKSGQAPGTELRANGLDLQGTDFGGMDLADIWWIECTLDDSVFAGAQMSGTRAYNCSWRACDFTDAQLQKSEMDDCVLARARLTRTNALRLLMHRCVLQDVDLTSANLDLASIFSSDLSRVRLRNAALDRVGLIDCAVAGIELVDTSGTLTRSLRINVGPADAPDWLAAEAALNWLRSRGAPDLTFFEPPRPGDDS